MRIAIYSRKSVYTGKGDSIENQVQMSKQYIYSRLDNVQEEDIVIYEDEGYSAKSASRPEFQRMLKDLRENKLDCIVCYRLDRISRNVGDFARLIEQMNQKGVVFLCIKEEFDTSKPMGKAMMYIASVFAQLERETIAERVRDNMYMLARAGRWLGGSPPTGYQSVRTIEHLENGKERTCYALKEDPESILLVKTLYKNMIRFKSLCAVYRIYISDQKNQKTALTIQGIRRILSNPVYCIADPSARDYFIEQGSEVCFSQEETNRFFGLMAYNKKEFSFKKDWIVAIGKHRGIICGNDWVKTQNLLETNGRVDKRRERNDFALLSNLIFCADCRHALYAKKRSARGGQFDYICANKLRNGKTACDCGNLNGNTADESIWNILLGNELFLQSFLRACDILLSKIQADVNSAFFDQDDRLFRCKDQLQELTRSLSHLLPQSDLYDSIQNDIVKLEEKINSIDKKGILSVNKESRGNFQFKATLETCSLKRRRKLLRLMIHSISWDGETLFIETRWRDVSVSKTELFRR